MEIKGSKVLPYVLIGSAVGGTLGYLFGTESGRKVRRVVANPEQLGESVDSAREFIEDKAQMVTSRVHMVLNKARESMEAGQQAFKKAEESYQSQFGKIKNKNDEVASGVHKTVDSLNKTASTLEETVLDPLYELGAIYRGVHCGIRTFFGRRGAVREFHQIS